MSRLERYSGLGWQKESGPARREHHGEVLTGQVILDGAIFENCHFEKATLVYAGSGQVHLNNCGFQDVQFRFTGPAANTLAFLKAMSLPGSGLREVVKASFPTMFGH